MEQREVLVQIGSCWFTIVFFLVLYCIWKAVSLRARYATGRISYRRYQMYRQQSKRTSWKVFGLTILIALILYGFMTAFNGPGAWHGI